jgi:hypothetical protein
MGTNYYLQSPKCDACGSSGTLLHVGKQSEGWKFLWRAHDDSTMHLRSAKDWIMYLLKSKAELVDEYGQALNKLNFIAEVFAQQKQKSHLGGHTNFVDQDNFELCSCDFC